MAAMTKPNGASGISSATLISALGLAVILFGAFWTIVQTQFNSLDKSNEIIRQQLNADKIAAEQKLSVYKSDVESKFARFDQELEHRRGLNVEQVEFHQFEKRLLDLTTVLRQQLLLLEQTRPTTGELQTAAKGLEARILNSEERLRGLELRLVPQAPPTTK